MRRVGPMCSGPTGFLKVLDERTIAYADCSGNVQYLSFGNLADNDRVTLILMDYANKARLKVWARARIVYAEDEPQLLARLEASDYRARVDPAVVMTIEGLIETARNILRRATRRAKSSSW